ncbi:hypothetical protein [Actinomadura madurae]|nr:hypothetical protein [Actinomadura madurae]MCQ0012929.1 hypothetical protein [Actinomadura madurae]
MSDAPHGIASMFELAPLGEDSFMATSPPVGGPGCSAGRSPGRACAPRA